jgi:(2R)-3-sulfolactate dehydrogenase (NADP+)
MIKKTVREIYQLSFGTAANCGASAEHASALAQATASAEAEGNAAVGLAHLVDYLDALRAGRIVGKAIPKLTRTTPIIHGIDCNGGMQHLGVELALDDMASSAKEFGLAAISSRNGFTIGALSYFPRKLAIDHCLVALAFANAAPAVMPGSGGSIPRFSTNPMAFAVPTDDGRAIVIDQSSSATAIVSIQQAAARGKQIPAGWALGPDGQDTTDPTAALAGVFLPFGGAKGANIALMVEVMSAAVTGADWSHTSTPFKEGSTPPSLGFFLLAITPQKLGVSNYQLRVTDLVSSLENDGAFVPGLGKQINAANAEREGVNVDPDIWKKVSSYL